MADGLDLTLHTSSDKFDPDDENWLDQEAELMASLRSEVGGVRRDYVAQPGDKGMIESVILALGSAGAFKMAVQCLSAWLARDRTRKIELAWTVDGREEKLVLQGTHLEPAHFEQLAALVRERMGR
jgi:hypothetical protein